MISRQQQVTRQGMELSITTAIYIATAIGAVGLFMMMPRRGRSVAMGRLGGVLAAVTIGGLWLYLAQTGVMGQMADLGLQPQFIYFYIFSAIAIGAAVRVITHPKPVYSALWFVMLVLASAGLMLTLAAEFMALAVVIIYGGAILVTYMFVIMLASRSGDPEDESQTPAYEVNARDPLSAIIVGFVLLALVLSIAFDTGLKPNPATVAASDQYIIDNVLTERAPTALIESLPEDQQAAMAESLGGKTVSNVEHVGLKLFEAFPLGIELAGVILLVSLVGAVVFARQRVMVEGDDDEKGGKAAAE